MKVAALAGGIGAGKFLRGLARVVPGPGRHRDREHWPTTSSMHGLHVSPDLDSVTYWLGDVVRPRARLGTARTRRSGRPEELAAFDRERRRGSGWGTSTWRRTCSARSACAGRRAAVGDHRGRRRPVRRGRADPADERRPDRDPDRRASTRTGDAARPPLPGVLGAPAGRRHGERHPVRGCRGGAAGAWGARGDRDGRRGGVLPLEPRRVDRPDPRRARPSARR